LIAGIDISTRELTAAIIPLDEDVPQTLTLRSVRLRRDPNATPLYNRVNRARWLRPNIHYLLPRDTTCAYVECPRGPIRNDPLTGLFDAVCCALPITVTVSGIDPQEWRRTLNLSVTLSKVQSIAQAQYWVGSNVHPDHPPLSEHQADALLVALAGRTEINAQVEAQQPA
jgi:hypothetical protein